MPSMNGHPHHCTCPQCEPDGRFTESTTPDRSKDFRRFLVEILDRMKGEELLEIPGVLEAVSVHLLDRVNLLVKNDVLYECKVCGGNRARKIDDLCGWDGICERCGDVGQGNIGKQTS